MSLLRPAYKTRYGYRYLDALRAEFWWRIEHIGPIRLRCFGYSKRKAAERRAIPRRLFDPYARHIRRVSSRDA